MPITSYATAISWRNNAVSQIETTATSQETAGQCEPMTALTRQTPGIASVFQIKSVRIRNRTPKERARVAWLVATIVAIRQEAALRPERTPVLCTRVGGNLGYPMLRILMSVRICLVTEICYSAVASSGVFRILLTTPAQTAPAIGAAQNSQTCCRAQPPTKTAGPVLLAGLTDRLVIGIPTKCTSVNVKPIAIPAKPAGA